MTTIGSSLLQHRENGMLLHIQKDEQNNLLIIKLYDTDYTNSNLNLENYITVYDILFNAATYMSMNNSKTLTEQNIIV